MSEDQKTAVETTPDIKMAESDVKQETKADVKQEDAKTDVADAIPTLEGKTEEEVKAIMAKAAKQSKSTVETD